MASGDTLLEWSALSNELGTTANFATFDTRNNHPVLDFDDTTAEQAMFSGVMPRNYAGGGVTMTLHWGATSGTSGTVVFTTAFEAIGTALDIDADSFATGNLGTQAAVATAGQLQYMTIAHTDGAQMDSLGTAQGFRIKVTRTVGDASDNMSGDAELRFVEMKET